MHRKLIIVAAISSLIGFAGCNKSEPVEGSSPANPPQVSQSNPPGPAQTAQPNTNSTPSAGTDSVTTAKVKNALMTSKSKINWKGINVDTAGSTVYLRGSVPNGQQKSNAESEAKKAAGSGFNVVDQLQVKGG